MPDIDELKFVRTFGFTYPYGHIPRELFEQIKEMDAARIDRIYKLGALIGGNPLTLLYVLVDEVNEIKGVLWAEINPIDAIIFIRLLSVDREYQKLNGGLRKSRSELLNKVKDFLFSLETGPELKKEIHFLTMRPGAFEKVGVKRSKRIRMEIHDGKNNHIKRPKVPTPDTIKSTEQ